MAEGEWYAWYTKDGPGEAYIKEQLASILYRTRLDDLPNVFLSRAYDDKDLRRILHFVQRHSMETSEHHHTESHAPLRELELRKSNGTYDAQDRETQRLEGKLAWHERSMVTARRLFTIVRKMQKDLKAKEKSMFAIASSKMPPVY